MRFAFLAAVLASCTLAASLPGSAFVRAESPDDATAGPAPSTGVTVAVQFREGDAVRLRGGGFESMSGRDLGALRSTLARARVRGLSRTFSRSEAELDSERSQAQARSGRQLFDLNSFFRVEVRDRADADDLVASLLTLSVVETAYVVPDLAPPPVTPNFQPNQTYLGAPPDAAGVEALWGVAGGRGAGVKIADVETCWQLAHEDLSKVSASKLLVSAGETPICTVFSNDPTGREHGTSVMGEIVGDNNGFGVTGISADADVRLAPVYTTNGYNRPNAIDRAVAALSAGDIILIEQQTAGANGGCNATTQVGCVPVEYLAEEFASISNATAAGIIVVEAAGNGSQNLDAAVYDGKFDRSVRDSGAIIVGAGAPAGGGFGTPRSKLDFSTYGSRVDVQAWGTAIVTTGYGDLQGGADANTWYTEEFGGTSGASPIVTGVAAIVQGIRKADGLPVLTSTQMRTLLRTTGSPQADSATFPAATYPIGPLVNATAAVGAPANDAFAAATAISPLPFSDAQNSENATPDGADASEPVPALCTGVTHVSHTLWYTFTSAANAIVELDTVGSAVDTVLAVYTGAAQNALTGVACNDDIDSGLSNRQSRVTLNAAAGVTYRVQVGSWQNDDGGSLALNATLLAPANDRFADAVTASPLPYRDSRQTQNATFSLPPPEPTPTCVVSAGRSVWYAFTAPADATFVIDTSGSDFDTVLQVYSGTTAAGLSPVACNDDIGAGDRDSRVTFTAEAGSEHRIQVSSYEADPGGALQLLVDYGPPLNDEYAQATTASPLPFEDRQQTRNATFDVPLGEPVPIACLGTRAIGHTVWYTYVAPGNGTYVIDTAGSDFDTVIGVYTGSAPPALAPVDCNDDPSALVRQARLELSLTGGTAYRIQIGSYDTGAGGDLRVRVSANDSDGDGCDDAQEGGTDALFGGARNALDPWDFFDVSVDRRIDLTDTLAVLAKFGAGVEDDGYDPQLDRYAPDTGQMWRTAPAVDGNGIDLTDALVNLASFGHDCTPPA
jgi:hypothetical protein